ncbi:tRNA (guanosine(37)-N1)-methyltransferase TrmD [Nostocoides sp. F2B08]|uniref:tRNA (guanosine(37)-N1)-methyltransferase TrmD n=1 Tax=Nostocoides sp. F2B08 TaxID=2653936 RepID=UPI001262F388|nr:tRNA (guanosine(37)-N1)-methyltransferase TrmD [Tetrasphaera sp. F2B08]KAB7746048.1 tRNA (guanosine(37)-N1)-methyltransferase TrmD [Tetrasphaera sp. F2B08]
MRIDVVTIFPDYLAPLDLSLIGKARRDALLDVRVHDLRDFTHDRHRTVDDTPFGGGAGMVMKPQPWKEALDSLAGSGPGGMRPRLIVPGPSGRRLDQALARELAQEEWLAFACGRYEGIDERVYAYAADTLGWQVDVVSLGDYVLNGGEVAVLAMVEAVGRLVPGVVGNPESLVEESHEDGLLEYPVYTKPSSWHDGSVVRDVPPVLLSGDHAAIARWRHEQRVSRTARRRPDLVHGSAEMRGFGELGIRAATPADAPELMVLTRACWVEEVAASAGEWEGPVESLDQHVAALRDWSTWVVRSGGRLVGSVRARRKPDEPHRWWIGRLMVAPDLQGRGLGRELLAWAEAQAPEDVTEFWLNTGRSRDRNLRMYRRAGYRVIPGESEVHPTTVDLRKPVRR